MTTMKLLGLGALAAFGAVAAQPLGAAAPAAKATAVLHDKNGEQWATATATQQPGGIRIEVTAKGATPGTHGLHIHAIGRCEAPDFTSAGPHWNPTEKQHGKDNPKGMHAGDLPNLVVDAKGRGSVSFTIAGASLRGGDKAMLDPNGAAIVAHTAEDDYKTDPSGNSGGRIACGVFE